ncbi:melanocortin-2 receptor accessory protein 2A [Mastacembelus armatus]|uniref:melanocortin-2 receptor accessory protein 2A n=1 Tax=Mastacembelus armatus TaxID=205130 RepID=UPI000E45D5EA|nr:melanocortin-2 receptor accessory protein 2A-like [Mastacembelus armatus]
MPGSNSSNGTGASPVPDYEWRYEYYDEEPVSSGGVEARHYSIVIGFWVGLAVFVIFMFFLLTLLTKTGAPHFDRQPCEKQPCLTGYMDASFNNGALPCQSLPFQCYISKEGQVSSRKLWTSVGSEGRGALGGCYMSASSSLEVGDSTFLQELTVTANATQKEDILLAHFSIPNCVNSEQSSSSGEDSLLLSKQELPVFLERRDQSSSNRNDDIDFT